MNDIVQFITIHGYAILFGALFAHQLGFPLPGPLFLLAAGAIAASRKVSLVPVVILAVAACVLADWVWYEAGRRRGDKVLHFLHSWSHDPDAHDRRAKRTFARFGLAILLIAKFVPGLDAVTPPLAGTSRTSRLRFLGLDAVGAGAYSIFYSGLGYTFSHDLDRVASYVLRAGRVLASCVALAGLLAFAGYKLTRRFRAMRQFPVAPVLASNSTAFSATEGHSLVEGINHDD